MKIYDTVAEILKKKGSDVWSVSPDTTVYHAIELMAAKQVGALLVVESDKLTGLVSERDYARKIILMGRSSKDTHVREIMTVPVITVLRQHTVDDCMRLMTENRVRHLPVLENDRLAGIVSIGDVVNWIMSAQDHTIQQLENYVSGKY
jgi:CBS domain-containing protein